VRWSRRPAERRHRRRQPAASLRWTSACSSGS
jgi:hypothetical protein